jgi:hypothetical protein
VESPSPDPPDNFRRPGSALDPRQAKLVEQLELFGPGPARFFRDACRVMNGYIELDTATHIVAHCLREVDSAIRAVLEPMVDEQRRVEIAAMKEGRHKAWIDEMIPALGFTEPEIVADSWWRIAEPLHALAHRDALSQPRALDESFRLLWSETQHVYGLVAQQFASSYLATMPLIDRLAADKTPVQDDVTVLRNKVPQNTVSLNRFFSQLESPGWLSLLRSETDYFSSPMPLERGEDGSATYTQWPTGQYLVRMAAIETTRSDVIEIALAIETDNPDAHERLTDAAQVMPPTDAAKLVDKICEWLRMPFQWALPRKATDLAKTLVLGGEVEAGLSLLRHILDRPRATDHWLFTETLKEDVSALFPAAGVSGIELLCELLDVELLDRRDKAPDSRQDYSYIWRPALESGRSYDAKCVLATALRNALLSIADSDSAMVPTLVNVLEKRASAIFRRFALDLLQHFPQGNDELIAAHLTDKELFADRHYRREYTKLAQSHFTSLALAQQEQVLDWIQRDHSEDETERRERWQLRELWRLGHPLPGNWERRYEELVERYGEYEERDLPEVTASFVGPKAPLSREELARMPVAGVLEFLRGWQPEERSWQAPTPEGLARLLEDVITADPVSYAISAPEFAETDPTYARALVTGLGNALREERTFDWRPVLKFAKTALTKPRVLEDRDETSWEDVDPGWNWTRKEIAHLLARGLEKDPSLSLEHANDVVALLCDLAEDPNPTPEDEAGRGEGMDPAMLSLNTVRGAAFHALMGYVWWRAKNREAAGLLEDGLPKEVAAVLQRHLDPAHDPTLTIRSVYGQWFPYLTTVDEKWARQNLSAIFPSLPELAHLRDIAWETYVTFNRPYRNTLELLRDDYAIAVELIGTHAPEKRFGRRDSDQALTEHLVTLFGHGDLTLDDPLLNRFFARAPIDLRGHAIEFVGISLMNAATVSNEIAARSREFWERRLAAFKAGETIADELKGFAWWFGSGKLDDDWSLGQLRDLLESGGRIDPDHVATERLGALVDTHPEDVVRCLGLVIDSSDRYWFVAGSRTEIRAILSRGLADGSSASRMAREIINRLAAQGHTDFIELL